MPRKPASRYNVYVVELDSAVLEIRKFLDANPQYLPGQPCVYVGMTSKSPEERFRDHKEGHKSNRYVRKYGRHLRPSDFEGLNPMTYDEAFDMEIDLAWRLRERGYGVWQN